MSVTAELEDAQWSPEVQRQIIDRFLRDERHGTGRWSEQAASTGHCARPVRLYGRSQTVDMSTGAVVSTYASDDEPDGVVYVRCGNRRAAQCPPCSFEYGGDTFHLIRAGMTGGDKGVPERVRTHPRVFATLTAPSFGPVHVRRKPGSAGTSRCRPRRDKRLCPHGRPAWCMAIHGDGDGRVGQPLCADCDDYVGQVVWQWWAPELWRRFTINLRRTLAARLGVSDTVSRRMVSLPFVKITEYQLRGAVHLHAVIRLDGPKTKDDPFPPPIVDLDSDDLAQVVTAAAETTWYDPAPIDDADSTRRLRFGSQIDARPIRQSIAEDGQALTEDAVAGYLAKYVSKATDDLDPGDAMRNAHIRRLSDTVDRLAVRARAAQPDGEPGGEPGGGAYARLGDCQRTLGYRGHCASKSRTFSTTMTTLRRARREHARRAALGVQVEIGTDLAADAEEQATVVIGTWQFAGMGWLTEGDAALAAMAAAQAREYAADRSAARRAQRA